MSTLEKIIERVCQYIYVIIYLFDAQIYIYICLINDTIVASYDEYIYIRHNSSNIIRIIMHGIITIRIHILYYSIIISYYT